MLRRLLIVRGLRFEDVAHEFLRVAVIEREPSALDLHHDAVTFLEYVIRGVQVYGKRRDGVWRDWLGLFERVAIAAAENFVGNHQFESGKLPILRHAFGIDID